MAHVWKLLLWFSWRLSEKDVVVIVVIEQSVNKLGWQDYMDLEKNKDLQTAPDKRSSCIVRALTTLHIAYSFLSGRMSFRSFTWVYFCHLKNGSELHTADQHLYAESHTTASHLKYSPFSLAFWPFFSFPLFGVIRMRCHIIILSIDVVLFCKFNCRNKTKYTYILWSGE